MTVHELKTWPQFFRAIVSKEKTFEVRRDDRDYKVGDCLVLREFDPKTGAYTGQACRREVTYALRGADAEVPGVGRGFIVMALAEYRVGYVPAANEFAQNSVEKP